MRATTTIHLGLPKTASTLLQEALRSSPAVHYVHFDRITPFRLACFALAASGQDISAVRWDDLAGKLPDMGAGKAKTVISDERLSGWRHFDFRQVSASLVARYQQICCEALARALPEARILIVLREPSGWAVSLYRQYVKSGESMPLADFLKFHGGYLKQIYSVDFLADLYRDRFGPDRVHVLPYEMLCEDASAFASDVEDIVGTAMTLGRERRYASLDDSTTELLRLSNKLVVRVADQANAPREGLKQFQTALFRFVDLVLVDQPNSEEFLKRLFRLPDVEIRPEAQFLALLLGEIMNTLELDVFAPYRERYLAAGVS